MKKNCKIICVALLITGVIVYGCYLLSIVLLTNKLNHTKEETKKIITIENTKKIGKELGAFVGAFKNAYKEGKDSITKKDSIK